MSVCAFSRWLTPQTFRCLLCVTPEELGLQAAGRQLFPALVFVQCRFWNCTEFRSGCMREGTRGGDLRVAVVLSALHPGASWRRPASGAGPGAGLWCPLPLLQACAEQGGLTAQLPARALWGAMWASLGERRAPAVRSCAGAGGTPFQCASWKSGRRTTIHCSRAALPTRPCPELGWAQALACMLAGLSQVPQLVPSHGGGGGGGMASTQELWRAWFNAQHLWNAAGRLAACGAGSAPERSPAEAAGPHMT